MERFALPTKKKSFTPIRNHLTLLFPETTIHIEGTRSEFIDFFGQNNESKFFTYFSTVDRTRKACQKKKNDRNAKCIEKHDASKSYYRSFHRISLLRGAREDTWRQQRNPSPLPLFGISLCKKNKKKK